jgi:hypothetical protein
MKELLTMTLKIIMALALAAAVTFSPVAGSAYEGHDHGKKAKKVKESKAKQAGIEFAVPRRVADTTTAVARLLPRSPQKNAIASAGLTTC